MTEQEILANSEIQIETPPSKSKRVKGNAIVRLAKATARKVRNQSDEISDAIIKRALAGDVNCTKLLLALIERLPPRERKYRSIAEQWANAPEWKPTAADADPDDKNFEGNDDFDDATLAAMTWKDPRA